MKRFILSAFALVYFSALALSATLLPNGKQTFLDNNGNPLANGKVYFYVPNTTTLKSTWQDSAQTVLNANPVLLDSAGRATIYGSGSYRQIVKDSSGNTLWDTVTADTTANGPQWAGISSGSANVQTVTAPAFVGADGQSVSFTAGYTNTASVTLVVNSTSYSVYKDMTTGPTALTGSEIVAQTIGTFVYDQSLGAFHIVTVPQALPNNSAQVSAAGSTLVDIGALGSHDIFITGNGATISSFGNSASLSSPFYNIRFEGLNTLSYSSAFLTPSGGNVLTASLDSAVVQYLGSGNWQFVQYQRLSDGGAWPGEVRTFITTSCPAGYITANGAAISRTSFPLLFAAVGTIWGTGDGSTTFNVPDFRGKFLRGFDGGANVDPGRSFASLQNDAFQGHTFQAATPAGGGAVSVSLSATLGNFATNTLNGPLSDGTHGTPKIANETRPINQTVTYCIKF